MNRVEIKEKAKKMIAGNKWYLWKPQVLFALIIVAIGFVMGLVLGLLGLEQNTTRIIATILATILSFFETAFAIGYAKYVLEFVRGNKMEWKEVLQFAKEHFGLAVLVSILVGLIVMGCSILLVIPGIIAAIGLTFYKEVCADNVSLGAFEIIKKAWNLTKGHKMDIFLLALSFIGWIILAELTVGILFIWLIPYMTVTLTLFYEELRKAA